MYSIYIYFLQMKYSSAAEGYFTSSATQMYVCGPK